MSKTTEQGLYKYLKEKNYTEDEALETVLRVRWNLEIPEDIKKDIKEYLKKKYDIKQCKLWHEKLPKKECKECEIKDCENKKEANQD